MPFQMGEGNETDESDSYYLLSQLSHTPSQSHLTWHSGTKLFASVLVDNGSSKVFVLNEKLRKTTKFNLPDISGNLTIKTKKGPIIMKRSASPKRLVC
jgi:hypothetical protein